MKVPDKIKIGCYNFKVKWEDKPIESSQLCYGIAKYNEHEIVLSSKMKKDKIPEILLHEIIHCICDMYNVDLTESIVNLLGLQIYQVIKDNNLRFDK